LGGYISEILWDKVMSEGRIDCCLPDIRP